jgi:hypothetical protein
LGRIAGREAGDLRVFLHKGVFGTTPPIGGIRVRLYLGWQIRPKTDDSLCE